VRHILPAVAAVSLLLSVSAFAVPPPASMARLVWSDLGYSARTALADAGTLARAPLRIGKLRHLGRRPLLIGAAALASIGALIALDEPIRREARKIGDGSASTLQTAASTASLSSLAFLYGAGLATENDQWRHDALTGAESMAVASALVVLSKTAFGRQRPAADQGATEWFAGGASFVSGATTPPFAAADAFSAAFGHRWWVTTLSYAVATGVGVGRMGQDRHWASDVLGSALLGIATTELFSHLHHGRDGAGLPLTLAPFSGAENGTGLRVSFTF